MTRNKYLDQLKRLGRMWKETGCNLLIVTAEAGAGHMRQAYFLERLAANLGVSKQVTRVDLSLEKDARTLTWNKWYKWLQNKPMIYETLTKMMNWPIWFGYLDQQLYKFDQLPELERRIAKSPNFDPKKPTILMVTHVIGAVSGANWLKKNGTNGWLVEFVPDPWRGGQLLAMTGPLDLGKRHLVVVHDEATALEYRWVRPKKDPEQILSLGTLSDPDYWWPGKSRQKQRKSGRHLLIEFSGNRIPIYEDLIATFLIESAKMLISENILVSVHAMHHVATADRMREIGKKYFLDRGFEVVTEKDLAKAVVSRQKLTLGFGKNGPVDVVITKGGEVTLEDRCGMLVAGVYGAGHEGKDIETGVEEGRVIDLRKINPYGWWSEIKDGLDKRYKNKLAGRVDSLAMTALLKAVPIPAFSPKK